MEFSTGATATLTMNAFTRDMRRETRITGTMGELRWEGGKTISLYDFRTRKSKDVVADQEAPFGVGTFCHGGADFFLMNAFTKAVASGDKSSKFLTDARESLRSHRMVFAAERSRINGKIELVME